MLSSDFFKTLFDLALVIAGFSIIILIHEAGHFFAARWAGIRTLAFALGFGPALFSYRRGMGFRRGSSEAEYQARLKTAGGHPRNLPGIGTTEYRWNVAPLGGYVKMLGQDDADPTARSDEPDSYNRAPVWKRMVVISAGVVMNVILAAVLFVVVFSVGLSAEPARIGGVAPGSPAATAVASNAASLNVTAPGLQPRDLVLSVDGEKISSFKDLGIAAAMSGPDSTLRLEVERPGVGILHFAIQPRRDPVSRMMSLGVGPAASAVVINPRSKADREEVIKGLARIGLAGVEPGMTLTEVNGKPAPNGVYDLIAAAKASEGGEVEVTFSERGGGTAPQTVTSRVRTSPEYQLCVYWTDAAKTAQSSTMHLGGLMPVMRIESVSESITDKRLQPGDVFAQLGDVEWPNTVDGILEIKRNERTKVPVVVWRLGADGQGAFIDLGEVPVRKGVIGFGAGTTAATDTILSRPPRLPTVADVPGNDTAVRTGGALPIVPGSRITAVDGTPVRNFGEIRAALQAAARAGRDSVRLSVSEPLVNMTAPPTSEVTWTLSAAQRESLTSLTWTPVLLAGDFEPEKTVLRAVSAGGGLDLLGAIGMGLHETRNVMVQTYLTFARLFQGTVRVEHLKGPVGIAHVGTIIADRGLIWLLFFMAVVSVNLAVINFLPLPIVDGGHFLFLLYEQATGRPVSVVVQNVATIAGLVMIGTIFLMVTYNDLATLLR